MALTITEQHWQVLRSATQLPADLTNLMELMRDNRCSEPNVVASLAMIRAKAEAIAAFCKAAEKRVGCPGN